MTSKFYLHKKPRESPVTLNLIFFCRDSLDYVCTKKIYFCTTIIRTDYFNEIYTN